MAKPTIESLTKVLKTFFYSDSIYIENDKVFNSRGEIKGYRVIKTKGRFRFERIAV